MGSLPSKQHSQNKSSRTTQCSSLAVNNNRTSTSRQLHSQSPSLSHLQSTPSVVFLPKGNPLESPLEELPLIATMVLESPQQSILKTELAPNRAKEAVRRPTIDVPVLPGDCILLGRMQRHRSSGMPGSRSPMVSPSICSREGFGFAAVPAAFTTPPTISGVHSSNNTSGAGGVGGGGGYGASASSYASLNRGSHTAAAGGSVTSYNRCRAYVGVESEFDEDEDGYDEELDDFALASTHSIKNWRKQQSIALESLSTSGCSDGCTRHSPGPRGLAQGAATPCPPPTMSATAPSSAAANTAAMTSRPGHNPIDLNEVLTFVSFRRPGFGECRTCGLDLAFGSNFCAYCGTPTDQLLTPRERSGSVGAALLYGGPSGLSLDSHSLAVSSALATPAGGHASNSNSCDMNGDDGGVNMSTPLVVGVSLSPRGSPGTKRKVYRRRVKLISRFKRDCTLGSGGSGTVLKGVDIEFGEEFAVKEMFVDPQDNTELTAIRNELRNLSKLRHRNIIEYLGCSIERVESQEMISLIMDEDELGTPLSGNISVGGGSIAKKEATLRVCLLMELMERGTLERLLSLFPDGMPETAVATHTLQLLEAVNYVHGCGLTHRDIKPSNILLTSRGVIKLSDFGSSVVSSGTYDTPAAVQRIAGTPAYMPPETLDAIHKSGAELEAFGKAQDVWAIGCVTHQMLTGKAPWHDVMLSNPFALVLHVQAHFRRGEQFPIDKHAISPEAMDFCQLCFERDPLRRVSIDKLLAHAFITRNLIDGGIARRY